MISVREFSWHFFTLTGNIDAYLLYKRQERLPDGVSQEDIEGVESDEED